MVWVVTEEISRFSLFYECVTYVFVRKYALHMTNLDVQGYLDFYINKK